jgi:hypothetical protein
MGLLKEAMIRGDFDREEALNHLIEFELEGTALGVAKVVRDRGEDALSSKQQYVYDRYVKKVYLDISCERCDVPIPLCELIEAWDNGGYCSWCAHQLAKWDRD